MNQPRPTRQDLESAVDAVESVVDAFESVLDALESADEALESVDDAFESELSDKQHRGVRCPISKTVEY